MKITALFLLSLFAQGCSGGFMMLAQLSALTRTVTLSSDAPLVYSYLDNATVITPTGTGVAPTINVAVPVAAATYVATGGTTGAGVGDDGSTFMLATAPTDLGLSTLVATSSNTFNLSLSLSTFANSSNATCKLASPFSALTSLCSTSGFQLTSAQLLTGSLVANVTSANGKEIATSSSVTSEKWVIEQVTDNKVGGDDAIDNLYASSDGNYLFMIANNSNAVQKLYALNNSDSLVQVTNTQNDQALSDFDGNHFSLLDDGTQLFFVANNSNGANKLFSVQLGDLSQVAAVSNTQADATVNDTPEALTLVGSTLYFIANNSVGSNKLYSLSSGTLSVVSNTINNATLSDTNSFSAFFRAPASYNSKIYWWSYNGANVSKLYRYDSTGGAVELSNTRASEIVDDVGDF